MREFTLRQLEYFIAVVDTGAVTAASRKVKVSQATVSMAIAQLESSLSAELFIRKRAKGVVPTRAGRELAARARRVLSITDELEEAVSSGASEMAGPIEVGSVSSLSPQVIPPLATHFSVQYPEVVFNYREGSAGELQSALLDGVIDVAMIFSRQSIEGVEAQELCPVTMKVMLPRTHRLSNRAQISFSEIAHEPAILIDLPPSRDRSIEFMRAAGVEPRIRWTSTNVATVASLVASGLGYSLRYSLPGETNLFGEDVVEIPISNSIPRNAISAVLPREIRVPRRVEEAIHYLQRYFAQRNK